MTVDADNAAKLLELGDRLQVEGIGQRASRFWGKNLSPAVTSTSWRCSTAARTCRRRWKSTWQPTLHRRRPARR